MKKSLIALAFGTLGLGISEFTMMGLLPYVADDFSIGIPTAGHLISAYAIGVFCGAPLLLVMRRARLKDILLGLAAVMFIGNMCAAAAPSYGILLAARFVSGLPHGAYFGVASIVASRLADEGKGTQAVSIMIAGMTVANLFGVPLGTSLGHAMSWRVTFMFVAVWSLITLYYILRWVPQVEGLSDTGFKGQFRFLRRPAPWLILGATMLGNGGVFCWYSYVSPQMTAVSGFSEGSMTGMMMLAGFGMVVGNLASGRLSDRYTPGRVAQWTQGLLCFILLAIFLFAPVKWIAPLLMAVCTAGLFAVSSPEQVLMIRLSPGGELLGGASVQMAFNLGNALGAYIGGLASVRGYEWSALPGAALAFAGFIMLVVFNGLVRKGKAAA